MVRTKDGDGIKSNLIVTEVQSRPCLYDTNHTNYGDRAEKARCWEEVCVSVVPSWSELGLAEKFAAGKEVQKRWRSIRDSYTKAYRQGKCVMLGQCTPGSRRYHYHRQMSFLLRALQNKYPHTRPVQEISEMANTLPALERFDLDQGWFAPHFRKPRYSQDKYESFSEVSNSPQHQPEDILPKIKSEIVDKPLDLKTKLDEKPETLDKGNQATIEDNNPSLEIKIDANSILPDDHFDDDKLFMNSLLPLFKKMDDDTRLLCRIEVLKIIRYALQGHKCFEALNMEEDNYFKSQTSVLGKVEVDSSKNESKLSMTTRSADGSRPIRKRKDRSPSPLPQPKRRGPGRPRKVRPPPSDSEEEQPRKQTPKSSRSKSRPANLNITEMDDSLSKVTSVAQLSTHLFMKMMNLERSRDAPVLATSTPQSMQVSVKTEPVDADL